jgi:hypothetical protein
VGTSRALAPAPRVVGVAAENPKVKVFCFFFSKKKAFLPLP